MHANAEGVFPERPRHNQGTNFVRNVVGQLQLITRSLSNFVSCKTRQYPPTCAAFHYLKKTHLKILPPTWPYITGSWFPFDPCKDNDIECVQERSRSLLLQDSNKRLFYHYLQFQTKLFPSSAYTSGSSWNRFNGDIDKKLQYHLLG